MVDTFQVSRGQYNAFDDLIEIMSGIQDVKLWKDQSNHNLFDVYLSNSKSGGIASSAFALPVDFLVYVPVYVGEKINISEIAFQMTTVPQVNAAIEYVIFDSYPDENYPRNRLATTTDTTGIVLGVIDSKSGIDIDLDPGLYWLGIVVDVALSLRAFDDEAATSVGYERNTAPSEFQNVLGYAAPASSFPATAISDMISFNSNVPALFALTNSVSP